MSPSLLPLLVTPVYGSRECEISLGAGIDIRVCKKKKILDLVLSKINSGDLVQHFHM